MKHDSNIRALSDAFTLQPVSHMKFEYNGELWRIVGTFSSPSFIVESDEGKRMHIGVHSFIAQSMVRVEEPSSCDG